jgi:hypothetical protein
MPVLCHRPEPFERLAPADETARRPTPAQDRELEGLPSPIVAWTELDEALEQEVLSR